MVLLRKKHRLNKDNYIGTNVYSVTIVSDLRKHVFTSKMVIDKHVRALNQACEKYKFDVIVYCFMPDHLHLLLQGRHSNGHLVNFIKNYKQITGHGYKQDTQRPLWQKSFYDHVLRQDEDVQHTVNYILGNPVRKQMVEQARDYPYSGSLLYGRKVFEW